MKDREESLPKSEEEWRQKLTKEQFEVLREKKTECAFRGQYFDTKQKGIYLCAGCRHPLFTSSNKFDSGTGWPSFWIPIGPDCIEYGEDYKLGYKRTEVLCNHCKGHLGHVFDDGPPPTNKRYCINSVALIFQAE